MNQNQGQNNKNRLTVIMKPTLDCNLSCSYCYFGDIRTKDKMTFKTLDNIMQKLSNKDIRFIWHGGEPLLMGIDFFEYALHLQKEYNIRSINNIQTNLTLLNSDWVDLFKRNCFEISSSLDGVSEVHNKGRSDSFDRVIYGIKTIRNDGLRVGVVSILSDYSLPYLYENFQLLKTLGISARINPQESCKGNVLAQNTNIKIYEFAMRFYYDLYLGQDKVNPIKILPVCEMFGSLVRKKGFGCTFTENCVGKFPSILASGDVYHCGRFIGSGVGYLGNANDSEFSFDIANNNLIQELFNINKERVLKCSNCGFYTVCYGGCFYNGWNNGLSKDMYCDAYRNIYRHIILRNKQMSG